MAILDSTMIILIDNVLFSHFIVSMNLSLEKNEALNGVPDIEIILVMRGVLFIFELLNILILRLSCLLLFSRNVVPEDMNVIVLNMA